MTRSFRMRVAAAAAALALAWTLPQAAEAQRPTSLFMSPADEAKLGRQEHPKILKAFGGAYEEPRIKRYVETLGQRLVQASDTPTQTFTFTVLDTDIVNAFALPGGYIYVTKGILALANNEAELAGVLAHEIGHVTQRHSAQRYDSSVLANIGVAILGTVLGSPMLTDILGVGAQAYLANNSRDDEYDADTVGVKILSRAGYDPIGMSSFLRKLQAESALAAQIAGRAAGSADQFDIMQSHPRTADRVNQAIRAAQGQQAASSTRTGGADYLAAIDGMEYGGGRAGGFVRDRTFFHPLLRFQFEVPRGFRLVNSDEAVVAYGPEGTRIQLDSARAPRGGVVDYLVRDWAKGLTVQGAEPLAVNGLEGATGLVRTGTRQGQRDLRLVAIRSDASTLYRFLFVTTPNQTMTYNAAFRETALSFRRLSEAEAAQLKPFRIRVVTVRAGDTVDSLAQRMPFDTLRRERFATLNGLGAGTVLRAGDRVKMIGE